MALLYRRRAATLRTLADIDLEIASILCGATVDMAPAGAPTIADPHELLTVDESAPILKLSPKSVYKLIDEGKLPVVRMSARRLRIRRSSLISWLERQEGAPRNRRGLR